MVVERKNKKVREVVVLSGTVAVEGRKGRKKRGT